MTDWHLLINKDDYRHTEIVESQRVPLSDGQVRLEVDTFGLTANNVTYAAAGDLIGYWTFFPAPESESDIRWGRTPVWGFADVIESRHSGLSEGERLYGYLPMSSELVIEPSRVSELRVTDGSPHRSELPAVYNQYSRCRATEDYDPNLEAEQMLYQPLFFTSFLIDDFLDDISFAGASTVILTSASSKTAFGTAYLLNQRNSVSVVGLTSEVNAEFVTGLGCYDRVCTYRQSSQLPAGQSAMMDMSGSPSVVRSVHEHYGDDLKYSGAVGLTHWDDRSAPTEQALPGAKQEMFFAPSRVAKRRDDWGASALESRIASVWPGFVDFVKDKVQIETSVGPASVQQVWTELVDGTIRPNKANVIRLSQ